MSFQNYHGGSSKILYSKLDFKRIDNLFYLQLLFFKAVGLIPIQLDSYLPKSWEKFAKRLANSYCIFSAVSTLHMALLYIKTSFNMLQFGALQEITDASTLAIIYSFACFSICYWLWNSKALLDFIKEIDEKHRHHSIAGLTFVSAHSSYQVAYNFTLYWQIACITAVVSWAFTPLILGSHSLPLNCWYPFDPLQPIIYEITYASQVWCQFLMGWIFGNSSALLVSLAIILLGQFDVLYCSLKNLDFHAQLMSGEDLKNLKELQSKLLQGKDDELNQYAFSKENLIDLKVFACNEHQYKQSLQAALHESLVECVQLHQFILKSCDTLEELFSPFCLVKSMQMTYQLCFLAFVGVAGQTSVMRAINLIQYLILTVSELFLFTYFGELLSNHSIRGGEALWRSAWWPHANLIKRDLLIFLTNTNRVVRLTAGKLNVMDVKRLFSVITQAFSFLTLLQKLAAKKK